MRLRAVAGAALPVTKVAVDQPGRVPQWHHLKPGVSQTVTEPALLRRAGPTLVLTWADSAGAVWQIDGLRPGRYTLRYQIEAQKGSTPAYWTTWTGTAQSEAVAVEVRE